MIVQLKYDRGFRAIHIPDTADVTVLRPATVPVTQDVAEALEQALDDPLGSPPLADLVRSLSPRKVAIAVPDETRPTPLRSMLPPLLKRLRASAPHLGASDVTVLVAGGLHPPMDSEGLYRVIPRDAASLCRVVAHDALRARTVDFGFTSRGTPVRINAEFAEADLRMVIGQIDPHQFVGYTGGSKGAAIGLAAAETIKRNHSFFLDSRAKVGCIRNNPVREDMNEAGRMVGIHLAINVVLDADKRVVRLLAGDPDAVLTAGAETCALVYGVRIAEHYDIVIASCGGYPKDICLYQAQKGLNLASQALKPGGKILLVAACPQGVGDEVYFKYVSSFKTHRDVLEDFQRLGFKMGAHKAFLFARTLDSFDVALASELSSNTLAQCHLRVVDPSEVVRDWVEAYEGRPRVAVVPDANTTFFIGPSP